MRFLKDRKLQLNGYQVDFEMLEQGLFYFTHRVEGCHSTMVVEAGQFFDLNPGVRYKERNTGKDDCPGYCLKKDQLDRCENSCECAYVRDVIDIIRNYMDNE